MRLLKYTFFALCGLTLITGAFILWLRSEFARVTYNPQILAQMYQVSVESLAPDDATNGDCNQEYSIPRAWFGALHVHTAASYDATAFGSTNTVEDAYSFGKGKPMQLPLRGDPADYVAPELRISSPLDFMAVTDHAEALGEKTLCYDRRSKAYGQLVCRLFRGDIRLPVEDSLQPMVRLASQAIFGQDRSARICTDDGSRCRDSAALVWQQNQRATEAADDNCEFTAFHAYEYTLAEDASNLHRNVIFKSATVPQAVVSAKEAPQPEQLWRWLDKTCIAGHPDCDVLAIPHNSNWSSGRMWFPVSASDTTMVEQRTVARLRAKLEPLAEVLQAKGDSECRNGIASVYGGADEFCNFEKLRPIEEEIPDCGETKGSGGMMLKGCVSRYSFVRYALTAGLAEHKKLGVNPFKMGIVAATDTHNGTPAAGRERGFLGSHGADRDIKHRLQDTVDVPGGIATGSPVRYNPGGIAGVYAMQNSRASLFEAMRRRETFGTSGPRITPRLFAGWDLAPDICQSENYLQRAYDEAVPMGSDLPSVPESHAGGPTFVASAARDPRNGSNSLQRIQIIKGWVDASGRTQQAVYDVAGNANKRATVSKETCSVTGTGFSQLCASWQDPLFDPTVSAVYYARVLENPSCRWSHYDCLQLKPADRPPSCNHRSLPWNIQERAWTSPIWFQANESIIMENPDQTRIQPM